jgi:hypothetical protein
MSRKVFTAGEVLAAADVNSFLMDQTVMSFAGTAARGSAIPTPVEGMYTHLEDTDRLQFWNGSSWATPFGLTLISNTTVTATPAVIIDNIFTSEYQNYRINIKFTASTSSMNMEPRASGTTVNGNFFTAILGLNYLGGATNILQNNTAFAQIHSGYSGARGANIIEVFGPTAAAETSYLVYGIAETTRVGSTSQINNEVVTGLRFSTANGTNFSANIRVYGYRN